MTVSYYTFACRIAALSSNSPRSHNTTSGKLNLLNVSKLTMCSAVLLIFLSCLSLNLDKLLCSSPLTTTTIDWLIRICQTFSHKNLFFSRYFCYIKWRENKLLYKWANNSKSFEKHTLHLFFLYFYFLLLLLLNNNKLR